MDNRKRRKLIIDAITEAVSDLGFKHHLGEYFSRCRGGLADCFFFQQSRSQFRFEVIYGIDAPSILTRLSQSRVLNPENDKPRLTLAPRISRLGPYGCKHEEHVQNSGRKVKSDLESHAIPWLEQVETVEDLVEAYRVKEIADDKPTGVPAAGRMIKWSIYGMMLVDSGKKTPAIPWLDGAENAWASSQPSDERSEWLSLIEATKQSLR
ncbi:MAG: hypothetical protein AAF596_03290 [Planctomycetota bacterium]